MLVVVVTVQGVTVPVVNVIHMVSVRYSNVAAAFTVDVSLVVFGLDMVVGIALHPVLPLETVDVPVMNVIRVIVVGECHVAAAFAVNVSVIGVNLRHDDLFLVFTGFQLALVFSEHQ